MSLDLSADWQLIDDPITVAFASRLSNNQFGPPVTVEYAQRGAIEKGDVIANPGLVQRLTVAFNLWTVKLSGAVPKIGDTVTDADGTWTVEKVDAADRDANGPQRYRCTTWKYEGRT